MKGSSDSIVWHEGLLLTPQHLQQNDRRFQSIISNFASSFPYSWGIDSLKINESNLPVGSFSINSISGRFQDGLFFSYESSDDDLSINLSEMVDGQQSLIHLTIPDEGANGVIRQEDSVRFKSYSKNVLDLVTGEPADSVSFFRPNLSLSMGDKASASKLYIPVGKVSFNGGVYKILDYCPPSWNVVGTKVYDSMSALLRSLQEKVQVLSSSSVASGNIYKYSNQLLFMAISSSIPLLRAKLSSPVIHPFDLYCVLSQIEGMVYASVYKPPASFSAYDHSDCMSSLLNLHASILSELMVISSKHSTVLFQSSDDGYYFVKNPDAKKGAVLLIGVKVSNREYVDEVDSWFTGCPVFSKSFSDQIKKNRISGMKRKRVSSNSEYDVSESPTTLIYELSYSDDYFKEKDDLCILNPSSKISGLFDGMFLFVLS